LIALREGRLLNERTVTRLTQYFRLNETDLSVIIESLKQQVTAIAHKIRRYDKRCQQYHQNRLFSTNPKRLFNPRASNMDVPEASEALNFWRALWEKSKVHNRSAEWIRSVEADLNSLTRQTNLQIILAHVQSCLKCMPNWKAPGNDMNIHFGGKNLVHYILAYLDSYKKY